MLFSAACRRIWGDRTWIPGVEVPFGAEIVHGDNTCITRLAKKEGWELSRVFTWAQGDGGPSETESPDGGAGYYYIGSEKRCADGGGPRTEGVCDV